MKLSRSIASKFSGGGFKRRRSVSSSDGDEDGDLGRTAAPSRSEDRVRARVKSASRVHSRSAPDIFSGKARSDGGGSPLASKRPSESLVTEDVFQPLLEVMMRSEFVCARAMLRHIDDEDDRDLVSIRSFAEVLSRTGVLSSFTRELIVQEVNAAHGNVTLLFRDNSSPSTRFLDVLLDTAKTALPVTGLAPEKLSKIVALCGEAGEDFDDDATLRAMTESVLQQCSILCSFSKLASTCYLFAAQLQSLGICTSRAARMSLTYVCILKVVVPALVSAAMQLETDKKRWGIKLAKHVQAFCNKLSERDDETVAGHERNSTVEAFDQFCESLVATGRVYAEDSDSDDSLSGPEVGAKTSIAQWKAFYRVVKRKMSIVTDSLCSEGYDEIAADLGRVKEDIEAVRRQDEEMKAMTRGKRHEAAPTARRKKSIGLYSVN